MDLNLLVALDALLEEGSVQGAADRLHLSAPAMSRTLARIRKATGDDILVRTGRTMTPTPWAIELRDEVRALVARAGEVLTPSRLLDLSVLERTFTVQGHDALTAVIAADLVSAAAEVPGLSFRILGEPAVDLPDLAHGKVDLAVGGSVPASPEISHEQVGEDRLVVAHRAQEALTRTRFAAADHVIVSRRGRLRDRVDDLLAEHGLTRRVVAALPTTAAVLHLVARTDVVAVVPDRATAALRRELGLSTSDLDLELPPGPVLLGWHSRYDTDPAHTWLRDRCRTALKNLIN